MVSRSVNLNTAKIICIFGYYFLGFLNEIHFYYWDFFLFRNILLYQKIVCSIKKLASSFLLKSFFSNIFFERYYFQNIFQKNQNKIYFSKY